MRMPKMWVARTSSHRDEDLVDVFATEPKWLKNYKRWESVLVRSVCRKEFETLFGIKAPPWPECHEFRVSPLIPVCVWVPA